MVLKFTLNNEKLVPIILKWFFSCIIKIIQVKVIVVIQNYCVTFKIEKKMNCYTNNKNIDYWKSNDLFKLNNNKNKINF